MLSPSRLKLTTTISLLLILIGGLMLLRSTRLATHAANTSTNLLHCGAWNVILSPNPSGATNSSFSSVAVISGNDVWAVGDYLTNNIQTLIEHWNGAQWSIIPSPNPGMNNSLFGIASVSTNDVWAVGRYETTTYQQQTLVEHWDGTQWSIIPSPSPTTFDQLSALSVNSATDIWAIGMTGFQPLIEHWDGTQWSIIPSPNYGIEADLNGVVAISSNNVWIVGRYETSSFNYRTFTEHWNGAQWSIISSPNIGTLNSNELKGVTRVPGTNQLWTVGDHFYSKIYTLTEHWNGKGWSTVVSPNPGTSRNMLFGAAAISATSVWAVGYYQNDLNGNHYPLIEHWNGSTWSVTPNPKLLQDSVLQVAARVPGTNHVWAIGRQGHNTLAEFYC
jgi:hypothetical protein